MKKKELTFDEAAEQLKYFSYYKEAYSAVLGGLVGDYEIQESEGGPYVKKYGLKAFSPIAKGFPYSDYDDFGVSRSYGYKRQHLGHDMMGQIGTPVICIESGYVEALGWNQYGGWRVGIRSLDKKRYYYYAHLRQDYPYQAKLKEGDFVTAGDVIGYMGHTGYSTKENVNNIDTVHLHYGLELIFDEDWRENGHEIWVDCYNLTRFLYKNRSEVHKVEGTKEWKRTFDMKEITQMAREGRLDPVIGREEEIQRVIQILSRRTKNNPCLIGEPGVGKTAIAEGLAARIVEGNVPETIKDKRLLTLDLSGMVAGSKYRGEFEERIKKVIAEVKNAGNVLLFLDEIHTIIGAGGAEGAIDASNILKPSLARGEIQLIGATTLEEYRKHIEKDAALERRFQPVKVEEPTAEEAIQILRGLKGRYEEHHHVTITDEAVVAAVKLSKRYINDRFLPDKAIDLIDEASSKTRLDAYVMPDEIKTLEAQIEQLTKDKEEAIKSEAYEQAGEIKKKQLKKKEQLEKMTKQWQDSINKNNLIVDEDEIASVVSTWTKIPVQRIAQAESERLMKLEETLHNRVIGQDEAVAAVAKAIRRGRVGLKDPDRPIGSFLFLGPTGVGKTELSKALADAMFGTENSLIRVDMSEFMEKHTLSKLIGSPPGYVGYDEGGQLSEKVRRNPYSVILFDEVEKAHPDVFNVLLQVLDDGHITDSTGRVIDFKNTIIIMTSNAGAENIVSPKSLGFSSGMTEQQNHEEMKGKVMDEVKRIFKPEFINRIDDIVVFHVLGKEQIAQIVDIMIANVNKRIMEQMKLSIELDDAARQWLVDKGYDSKYGARPLRRTIQNEVEDVLAERILMGKVHAGNKVKITVKENKLNFTLKRGMNK